MKDVNRNYPELLKHNSFYSYLKKHLSKLPLVSRFKEIYVFLRKYLIIGRILRITKSIILFLQASTVLIIFATVILIVLPLVVMVLLVIFFTRLRQYKFYNKQFGKLIKKFKFCVVFIDDDEFSANSPSLCSEEYVTLFVSENPMFLIPKIIKRLDKNCFFLCTGYFYSLKKHIINKHQSQVFYIFEEDL